MSDIVTALATSWRAYTRFALGHDELRPVTRGWRDPFGGIGITLLDSLDTLILANATSALANARQQLAKTSFATKKRVSTFEVTIRGLGGLLSAYALTGDPLYKTKALDLGERLLRAFAGGLPRPSVVLGGDGGVSKLPRVLCTAEVGSLQLEFGYLSHISGDDRFRAAACRAEAHLVQTARQASPPHLLGVSVHAHAHRTMGQLTAGAGVDSYYEYLLKQWLITGRRNDGFLREYRASRDAIERHLVARVGKHRMLISTGHRRPTMGHLDCFVPGMLALSAHYDKNASDLVLARDLMESCWMLYALSPTVGAEAVSYHRSRGMRISNAMNILRPEVAESLFYMWRVTGDAVYRNRSTWMFRRFQEHSQTQHGYAGLRDVTSRRLVHIDRMESFWIAETLKYLLLTHSDANMLDLDKWVLNTEAHPLPVDANMRGCSI